MPSHELYHNRTRKRRLRRLRRRLALLALILLLLGGVGVVGLSRSGSAATRPAPAIADAEAAESIAVETWAFDATLFEGLDGGETKPSPLALAASGDAEPVVTPRSFVVFSDVGERPGGVVPVPSQPGVSQLALDTSNTAAIDELIELTGSAGGGASSSSASGGGGSGDPDDPTDPTAVPAPSAVAIGLAMLTALVGPRRRRPAA